MSSEARTPLDQGCGPVLSTVTQALRCFPHESSHGFADGSPGRQGASSFPTLFISLFCIFLGFRRRRHGSVSTKRHLTSVRTSVTGKLHKKTNQAKLSFLFPHAHSERQKNKPSDCGHQRFSKELHVLFSTSRTIHTTRWHKRKEGTPSFHKNTLLQHQNSEGTAQPAQLKRARRSRSFSFISLHIPLLCCHNPSTVRAFAAVTVPQESFSGTLNTVNEENPAILSSSYTHPSFLGSGSTKPSARPPNPLRKEGFTSLDQFCPATSIARFPTLRS